MAFIIDDKKSDNQTVTSTPLTSGNSTPAPNTQPQNQSSTSTSPAQGQSTSPQPPPPPKKSSGSGMFTNIQKYVEKNKPKATEMGQSSLDAIRKAGEDAKSAQTEALSSFNTRATEGGLHDTDARVGQLEDYTRDQAGFNGQPSSQPQEATSTAAQDIADYNSELKNRYYQDNEMQTDTYEGNTGGYNGPTPVTFEEWRDKFEPNYQDRINEINSSYQTQDIPAVDPTVSSNGVGQPMIDERRFQEIINATYGGPRSLVETGNIYRDLAEQAAESARYGENVQSEQGRKQFLKDVFSEDGKDYGSGLANLDEYILGKAGDTPGQYLQQLMDEGKSIGSEQDILREASRKATDIASGYESDIATTREQARAKFSDIADERQGEINTRINEVIENWDKLPAHFREAFTSADGSPNISAIEANIVGVQSGEGLYGMQGKDLFAEKGQEGYIDPEVAKLISQQESGNLQRLKALSDLARTNQDLFNISEDYTDFDKAGTQNAMDALNLERVREKLAGAEENFRNFAAQDVTGKGRDYDRYDAGWGKTKKAYANAEATSSLKEVLSDQGYDFDSEISTADNSNYDLLKNLANLTDIQKTKGLTQKMIGDDAYNAMEVGDELLSGNAGLLLERLGLDASDVTGLSTLNNISDEVGRFGDNVGGVGGDIISGVAGIGSDVIGGASTFVNDVGSQIFGGGKSAAKKKAYAKAKKKAYADLKKKMEDKYKASNFDKRINIDNESTLERDKSLMDLLGSMDKTNLNEE